MSLSILPTEPPTTDPTPFWHQTPTVTDGPRMVRRWVLMFREGWGAIKYTPMGYAIQVWDKYNELGSVSTGYKCECGEFREFRPVQGFAYPMPPFDMANAHAKRHADIARFN